MLKLGHDVEFFNLLETQAEIAQRAARMFLELSGDFTDLDAKARALNDVEHEGDEATRTLNGKILSTFMTPMDKEDLRELSQTLDDVTDAIESAAARASLYRLKEPRPDLRGMAEILVRETDAAAEAVKVVRKNFRVTEGFGARLEEIHRLENEGDSAYRKALVRLFDEPNADPLTVIKWKEVYDHVEVAFDKVEDIAKVLGNLLIKYA
ncbi:DUF47 family protein [bacterium]|nr:MAG: DUF47 family protein [bacterium]